MGLITKLLNRLFGQAGRSDDKGLYFYIKLARGGEIVRLRINPGYELTPRYEEGGFITRKLVTGPRSYNQAEVTLYFGGNRQLLRHEIEGGEMVTEEAYQAQEDALTSQNQTV